jgi:flagellar protein FliL
MKFIVVVGGLTMIAGGVGVTAGAQLFEIRQRAGQTVQEDPTVRKVDAPPVTRFPKGAVIKPLAPIVTNLGGSRPVWLRLEAALILAMENAETKFLVAELGEDLVAYLRTIELRHIQGPSGFQHLRDDLDDRARIRTKGKSLGIIIQSLVVE